jgi:nitrogen regulatory protein PII
MKLLIIIHRDDTALEAFIEAARQANLAGFTLIRSSGIGRTSQHQPLEFGFMGLLTGQNNTRLENSTLLSFVHDQHLTRVLELLNQHIKDFNAPGGGMYAVLPVESYGGVE